MGIQEDQLAEARRSNELLEDILAKVTAILNVIGVNPNQPPQYVGPQLVTGTVGVPTQLQGLDGDGDPITWSMDASEWATITAGGQLTPSKASPVGTNGVAVPQQITVYLDDGKA
jgi:hypothetical protein